MTDKKTLNEDGATSDLSGLLDVLRQSPRQATVNEVERLVDYADSLSEQMKRQAIRLKRKDWHRLSAFDLETVRSLEELGYLHKASNGFVGDITFNI